MEKLLYFFGGEGFYFEPSYKDLHDFLVPTIMFDKKKSKKEVEKMLEDDNFFEWCIEEYEDGIMDWFKDQAEEEYENMLDEVKSYDDMSYEEFCAWRNPSLLGR